jgi:hypothetical protein
VMMMLMTHDDCKCGATSGLRVGANMFKLLERCIYIYNSNNNLMIYIYVYIYVY